MTSGKFEFSATQDLLALEEMTAYNRSIARLLSNSFRSIGVANGQILDFGAGIGTISVEMRRNEGITPLALEIDESQAAIIAKRGFTVYSHLNEIKKPLDACFASNVLEHIEDDVGSLKSLHAALRVGGAVAIYVPAFRILWTQVDDQVGHHRRYTAESLDRILREAGFRVVDVFYCDFLGFFAVLILKMLRARRKAETNSAIRLYDRWILPASLFLDRIGGRRLVGKNVFALAIKER